jgi:tetratricopeptide (TPR) repeat protein
MFLRLLFAAGCFGAALLAAAHAAGMSSFPADARPAHAANPRDTAISLQLGLELESSGDLGQAEQILLEAARFDHQYQPAWTLANYYFRRNQTDQFWQWARRAAELSYDDGRPLLRLATSLDDDPSVVVDRLGRRPVLLRTYLDILIGQNRKDAAKQVASMLAEFHDPADQPRFDALKKRYEETK